jgi:hypothetical protein
MTSTLAFSLIAALLMGGVIADSFLRKRFALTTSEIGSWGWARIDGPSQVAF